MKKIYQNAEAALDGLLHDGMTIAAGGFGLFRVLLSQVLERRDVRLADGAPRRHDGRDAPVEEGPVGVGHGRLRARHAAQQGVEPDQHAGADGVRG